MKKVLAILISVLILCSCTGKKTEKRTVSINGSGVWISYYELEKMIKSHKGFKSEFKSVINNCKELNIQNLYIHTRAFGETLYESKYFPTQKNIVGNDYDILEYIISASQKAGLKIHAWINPYRISGNINVEKLNKNSPAYIWLNDDIEDNDNNIGFANGIYLNPSSNEVRKLVLDEIRELLKKYDIAGIHFDDYFYPTQNESFDKNSYYEYKNTAENNLNLSDWRRENVNMLISSCQNVVKYSNKNIVFSISPTASNKNNYENLYADVEKWVKNGWVDEIIPQLYFGFDYPDKNYCFERLLAEWKYIAALNSGVKLKIGLASYKAKPNLEADKEEWEHNYDIIARQIEICEKDNDVSGYVYFSYSSLFGDQEEQKAQRENIKEYLKKGES